MKNPPLDGITWSQVDVTLKGAIQRGLDPAEELNRQNLLSSPWSRLQVQRSVLGRLLERLHTIRPAEMGRRAHGSGTMTPTEMYGIVVGFIEEYRDALQEE